MDALFTLLRQLAFRQPVTESAAPKWLVQRHRLGPLAARSGQGSYREDLIRATLDWARVETDLAEVVTNFSDNGIRVVPIKGVAYAKALYATPAERPMADIDLLVQVSRREAARTTLARLGFVPAISPILHHAEAWVRGDQAIDLHWNIIGAGRAVIDLDAVWSRTRPGWPPRAEQLDDCDALVFHLVNLARNRLCVPLIHVVDAARLLERASGDDAVARACDWRLGGAVAMALRFCSGVLGDDVERPAGWLGPTRAEVAMHEEPTAVRKVMFDIAMAGSARQLFARAVGYGANQLRDLARKSKRVT